MPANLRTCADCSTQYAIDLSACPHCGSTNSVDEGGVVTERLPLFVTLSCPACGRGPWTVRLQSVTSGLIDLPTLACASCGSQVPVTWPPEEEPMSPKITAHGGASNARDASSPAVHAGPPQDVAEDVLGPSTAVPEQAVAEQPEPEQAPAAADAVPVAKDYGEMSLAELRAEADSRGVPSYGTKAQITERLQEADAAPAE